MGTAFWATPSAVERRSRPDPQLLELAIERREAHAQPAGCLALVVAAIAKHALDVPALVVADGRAEVVAVAVGLGLDDQARREVVGGQDRVLARG